MKTINPINKVKKFYDKSNKYIGFAGKVKIYSKEIYVDTRNGKGYEEVIKELNRYIIHLAYKYNLSSLGFSIEDTKQHIIMYILESILKYDHDKNMTLSTFIHMAVERKMINEIRSVGLDSKNPTILKTCLYSITCRCGRKFTINAREKKELEDKRCYNCSGLIKDAQVFPTNTPPKLMEDLLISPKTSDNLDVEDIVSDESFDISMVYGEKIKLENNTTLKCDMEKWMSTEDSKIKKLVELVCFQDYSINSAAKIVGISHVGAGNKLKGLRRKKIIRDMFNRKKI